MGYCKSITNKTNPGYFSLLTVVLLPAADQRLGPPAVSKPEVFDLWIGLLHHKREFGISLKNDNKTR